MRAAGIAPAVLALMTTVFGCAGAVGRQSGDVRLVVNVDDAGMSPEIGRAAVLLWKTGAVSSASIIPFGEDFDYTAALFREQNLPVGVHLALNHGSGVLGPAAVPSLHGPDGRLWETTAETRAHRVPEEVRKEFDAQIRKVIDSGLEPVHLDSHMGSVFEDPALLDIYRDLALEYRLSAALPAHPYFDQVRKALAGAGLSASVSLEGVYTLPGGAAESPSGRSAAYAALLAGLAPGLNHLYTHPINPSAEGEAFSSDYPIRKNDYELLSSPEWQGMLKKAGVRLGSYPARP